MACRPCNAFAPLSRARQPITWVSGTLLRENVLRLVAGSGCSLMKFGITLPVPVLFGQESEALGGLPERDLGVNGKPQPDTRQHLSREKTG